MPEFTDIVLGVPWRPSRDRKVQQDYEGIFERHPINKVGTGEKPQSQAATSTVPKHVLTVSVTESPSVQNDRVYSLVSVSFTRDSRDSLFNGVRIWFKGYKGNVDYVLMADGRESPISFLCESTQETVVVAVQAVGSDGKGADLNTAPTATVKLDGVISAPPDPTIAQSLVTIPNGLQFSFNYITGLASDLIAGYWIYRNDTDEPLTAVKYRYVTHSTLGGVCVFQDLLGGGVTKYYWVTAINSAGLESNMVSAGEATSGGGETHTTLLRPTAQSGNWLLPTKAYDANEASSAWADVGLHETMTHVWSGFAAAPGTPTSIKLKVVSEALKEGSGITTARVRYSLNGGVDWSTVHTSGSDWAKHTDSVTLNVAQDLTQVQVEGYITVSTDPETVIIMDIYEIWIEVIH